jgi:hypothetical protein
MKVVIGSFDRRTTLVEPDDFEQFHLQTTRRGAGRRLAGSGYMASPERGVNVYTDPASLSRSSRTRARDDCGYEVIGGRRVSMSPNM